MRRASEGIRVGRRNEKVGARRTGIGQLRLKRLMRGSCFLVEEDEVKHYYKCSIGKHDGCY